MKVAFVNQPWDASSPPHPTSSIAIWTQEVACRLAGRAEVVIYERVRKAQPRERASDGVTYVGVPTELDRIWQGVAKTLPRAGGGTPRFGRDGYYRGYARKVASDLWRRGTDVVHVHNFSQFAETIRRHDPRIRIVLHMNCQWLTQLDARVIDRRLRACDAVVGCSEFITDLIREKFPQHASRCTTVYNGFDAARFCGASPPAGGRVGRTVLYVGRISPEKGVHDVIEAFRALLPDAPDARLVLAGPFGAASRDFMVAVSSDEKVRSLDRFYGEDYAVTLRRMAGDAAARIEFTGGQSHAELAARYAAADVFVLGSLTEAFPLTVVEAMAAGLPVVATGVGGVPEAVADGETGFVVESGRPEALAGALRRLLSDEALRTRMGRLGRERALERFSWDAVAAAMERIYAGASRAAGAAVD